MTTQETIDDITLTGGLAGCIFYPVCDFPPRGSLKQGTTIYGLRNLKNLSLGRINYGILYIIHIISPNQIIRSIRSICLPIKKKQLSIKPTCVFNICPWKTIYGPPKYFIYLNYFNLFLCHSNMHHL